MLEWSSRRLSAEISDCTAHGPAVRRWVKCTCRRIDPAMRTGIHPDRFLIIIEHQICLVEISHGRSWPNWLQKVVQRPVQQSVADLTVRELFEQISASVHSDDDQRASVCPLTIESDCFIVIMTLYAMRKRFNVPIAFD